MEQTAFPRQHVCDFSLLFSDISLVQTVPADAQGDVGSDKEDGGECCLLLARSLVENGRCYDGVLNKCSQLVHKVTE